jgi:hypothetical protein
MAEDPSSMREPRHRFGGTPSGEPLGRLEQHGVDERLGEVPAQLPLPHVVLLGERASDARVRVVGGQRRAPGAPISDDSTALSDHPGAQSQAMSPRGPHSAPRSPSASSAYSRRTCGPSRS